MRRKIKEVHRFSLVLLFLALVSSAVFIYFIVFEGYNIPHLILGDPNNPLATPITTNVLDVATEWMDGNESIIRRNNAGIPVANPTDLRFFMHVNPPSQNAFLNSFPFALSLNGGQQHLRAGFRDHVRVGTIVVASPGTMNFNVSVLRADVAYPGNISRDSDWIGAEKLTNPNNDGINPVNLRHAYWVLPPNTDTRAIRLSRISPDSEIPHQAVVNNIYVFSERYINIAPYASVDASSSRALVRRIINSGTDSGWDNTNGNYRTAPDTPVVSNSTAEWVTLTWSRPVPIRGLAALRTGFRAAEAQVYVGSEEVNPSAAPEDAWQTVDYDNGFRSLNNIAWYPRFLDFGRDITTRAVRLRITDPLNSSDPMYSSTFGGKRVWLGELEAIYSLGNSSFENPFQEEQPPISFDIDLPSAGYLTLVIENSSGVRVRNLVSDTYYSEGLHTFYWDGKDECCRVNGVTAGIYETVGRVVPAGSYTARGILHDGLNLTYELTALPDGNPPWRTPGGTGGMFSDHRAPAAVLYLPNGSGFSNRPQVLVTSPLAESGHGLTLLDVNGTKIYGAQFLAGGWDSPYYLARDLGSGADPNNYAYGAMSRGTALYINAMRYNRQFSTIYTSSEISLSGLAVHNGLIVASMWGPKLSFFNSDGSIIRDLNTSKLLHSITFDRNGDLFFIVGREIWKYEGINRDTTILPSPILVINGSLPETLLHTPVRLAIDSNNGDIYVSDAISLGILRAVSFSNNPSNQVKVFDRNGIFVRAIGEPGLGNQVGPYNPRHMNNPFGITIVNNTIWVAENSFIPKRVSIWDKNGTFLKGIYGDPSYGGGGNIDPVNKSRFYYSYRDRGGGVEYALNWESGESTVVNIYAGYQTEITNSSHYDSRFNPPISSYSAAPQTAIHYGGRQYMTNAYTTSDTVGAGLGGLWIMVNGTARPVAAFGTAVSWPLLQNAIYVNKTPGRLNSTHHHDIIFFWADSNGNYMVEPDEVNISRPIDLPSGAGSFSIDKDLVIVSSAGWRIVPYVNSTTGVPYYNVNSIEYSAGRNVALGFTSGGAQALYDKDLGMAILTGGPLRGYKNGTLVWIYPNEYPSLHASHYAPLPKGRGYLIGTTRLLGEFVRPNGTSEKIWAINGNMGNVYLFTSDGMYVGELGGDIRTSTSWSRQPAVKGMSLTGISFHDEHFMPTINQVSDGSIYLVAGKQHSSVVRVSGLESIRRVGSASFTLSSEDIARATEYVQRQATRSVREGRDSLNVSNSFTPLMDGNTSEWPASSFVYIDDPADIAGTGFTAARGAVAISPTHLYAAYRTSTFSLVNSEFAPTMFSTGSALDLMIGTNPESDFARTGAAEGDVRLLVSKVGNNIKALLYRQVGNSTNVPIEFASPLRSIYFDEVIDVTSNVTVRAVAGGDYEIAIPLSTLKMSYGDNLTLLGDIGILRGELGNTHQRSYWHNKGSGITSDIPSEAELLPQYWGYWRIGNGTVSEGLPRVRVSSSTFNRTGETLGMITFSRSTAGLSRPLNVSYAFERVANATVLNRSQELILFVAGNGSVSLVFAHSNTSEIAEDISVSLLNSSNYLFDNIFNTSLRLPSRIVSNQAPTVELGEAINATVNESFYLNAIVLDDGLPSRNLNISWSVREGAAERVVFENSSNASTRVTIAAPGPYILAIGVSDGILYGNDTKRIRVHEQPAVQCTGEMPTAAPGVVRGPAEYRGTNSPTAWTYNQTAREARPCLWKCRGGYIRNGMTCEYETELDWNRTAYEVSNTTFVLRDGENNTRFFSLSNFTPDMLEGLRRMRIIRAEEGENRSFLIISNASIPNQTKTIYLDRLNSSSNGVCFADRNNLTSKEDILSSCINIQCPGTAGVYSCAIENETFVISGLTHSGAIETVVSQEETPDGSGDGDQQDAPVVPENTVPDNTDQSSGGGGGGGGGASAYRDPDRIIRDTEVDSYSEDDGSVVSSSGSTSPYNIAKAEYPESSFAHLGDVQYIDNSGLDKAYSRAKLILRLVSAVLIGIILALAAFILNKLDLLRRKTKLV